MLRGLGTLGMAYAQPSLQVLSPLLFGSPLRHPLAKIRRLSTLEEVYACFGHLLADAALALQPTGPKRRARAFTPQVTLWAGVHQVLHPGTSCAEITQQVDAWWVAQGTPKELSASSSAYCQARARLEVPTLELIRDQLAHNLERHVPADEHLLPGRCVKVLDGTTLSLADTPANQELWPQSSSQKPGLGFPQLQFVALFSLESGALLAAATGSRQRHESRLARNLYPKLQSGDVLLADRAFCSFGTLATLRAQGVDAVLRQQMRSTDFRQGQYLGRNDRLVTWTKPQRGPSWSEEEYAALPETLTLRMVRVRFAAPGARTQEVVLITTLLDPECYPVATLGALYLRRWQVELHFSQIKTHLGMDVLRGKSPQTVVREVLLYQIAYNFLRVLLQESANQARRPLGRLSFKSALHTLRAWSGVITAAPDHVTQTQHVARMLQAIAAAVVPARPDRSEPRARKRRPKNYQLLTQPRHQMKIMQRRSRHQASLGHENA